MKKATPKLITTFTILIVALVAFVAYYAYLANRKQEAKDEATLSAVQETLSRNMNNNYPATPKEVIKYYNEILKCFYNEECTDEEIEELGQRARELYDAELLEANELGTYMLRLREEIADYKENNRRIINAVVAASTNVDYFMEDGFSFARIMCVYYIMEGDQSYPTNQVYLLRKDDENHWKIYGWEDASNLQINRENETVE